MLVLATFMPAGIKAQNSSKRGGVGFRLDENPPVNKIHSYDSLFARFGFKYSFAVTTYVLPLVPEYVDTLRALAGRGVELMDNTPTHATQFFNVLYYPDTLQFSNKPGVDHIRGQKICLKYISCDTAHPHGEGYLNIFGNKVISYNPGEFHDLLSPSPFFAIYLKAPLNRLCLYYDVQSVNTSDPDTLYVKSFWDEPLTLGDQWYFQYRKILNNNVQMHDSAVGILGSRSLEIFDSVNLARPLTWVHPDGQYPWIDPVKIKSIMGGQLYYEQSTTFINPAFFCYNEYNPIQLKQFSIKSDSLSMETLTFRENSHILAEAVAKHYVSFDFARLTYSYGGFHAYLQRMDSLLSWCSANNIPVRTYSQWKSLLYDSIPGKVANIFPGLNTDLDKDGWPDGFDHDTLTMQGRFDPSDGVASSGGKCFRISEGGTICKVNSLAGLEKGSNKLVVSAKGTGLAGSTVDIRVEFPETGSSQTFNINSDTAVWIQHYRILNIPAAASIANITFTHDTAFHDTVKVSGIELRSSGFLSENVYPLQQETANNLFPSINLNSIVIDSIYNPSDISWTFKGSHSLSFAVDTTGMMKISRPYSFWVGKDSMYAIAHSPDGLTDSCFFRFRSDSVPYDCAGQSISISILDTITSSDYIVWTSQPYDSTMSDTTIFNPTVSPKVTTRYRVKVYNLLGNIFRDSILITRYPYPDPGLFRDSTICQYAAVVLTAQGAEGTHFLWSTGDTTASITVKPDTTTEYTVHVTNQWNCSADDTTLITVNPVPVVTLSGLLPQYCSNDNCVTMSGSPWYGQFGGTSGVFGSMFCPNQAKPGLDTVWFQVTTPQGCYDADTVFVQVNLPPVIPVLPDTNLCGNKTIFLDAGAGADNYLWSNGDTTRTTVVDSVNHGLGMLKVWVYVTRASCVAKDTAYINFIDCPTAVNDMVTGDLFVVYPNPFTENISIRLINNDAGDDDKACLLDLRGNTIASVTLAGKSATLKAGNISPGVYLFTLRHGGKEYYLKVVKL